MTARVVSHSDRMFFSFISPEETGPSLFRVGLVLLGLRGLTKTPVSFVPDSLLCREIGRTSS